MVRIYARENATQRSKQVTALDGSVLASVRWLVRQLLTGTSGDFTGSGGVFESEKAFESSRGRLTEGDGIGRDLIRRVLHDMPGMTENSIRDSLSRLKSSGDYARNLTAITQQIEAEVEAARHFHRFCRYPWEVRQRQKLYKNCTFRAKSCTPKGGK